MAGRLDDEDILAADVFVDFYENFVVGKALDACVGERNIKIFGNFGSKRQITVTRHEFHSCVPRSGGPQESPTEPHDNFATLLDRCR